MGQRSETDRGGRTPQTQKEWTPKAKISGTDPVTVEPCTIETHHCYLTNSFCHNCTKLCRTPFQKSALKQLQMQQFQAGWPETPTVRSQTSKTTSSVRHVRLAVHHSNQDTVSMTGEQGNGARRTDGCDVGRDGAVRKIPRREHDWATWTPSSSATAICVLRSTQHSRNW